MNQDDIERNHLSELKAEEKLLICCARTECSSDVKTRIDSLINDTLNWRYVVRLAKQHGLLGLLYWHLSTISPQTTPDGVLNAIRDSVFAYTRRNLLLTQELARLIKLLNKNHIDVIPYKGPSLAQEVYGTLALRRFVDLDILIHKRDMGRVKELLLSEGYAPRHQWNAVQETIVLRYGYDYPFTHQSLKIKLEVHWVPFPVWDLSIDEATLWDNAQHLTLCGVQTLTLGHDDLLLILCAHAAKHCWARLSWICDIAELTNSSRDINWPHTLNRAERLHCKRRVLISLLLAHDLLDARIPESVLNQGQHDEHVLRFVEQIKQCLFQPADDNLIAVTHIANLQMKETRMEKVRLLFKLALIPTLGEYEAMPLPPSLIPLYYVVRPVRLLATYTPRLLRSLF